MLHIQQTEHMSYFSCSRTAVKLLEVLVALKLRFIDKRWILIISRTELLANCLHHETISIRPHKQGSKENQCVNIIQQMKLVSGVE
jgi:hypothetical protein